MLNHKISTTPVFMTDQYKDFVLLPGNRPINVKKCDRIIKQIEAGNDMLEYYPIQVRSIKEKLGILDGQNRFYICKKLKRVVHYILVKEEKEMADIASINSNVEKWSQQNFIDCYIQKGNQHYVTLKDFIAKYGFNVGSSLLLLTYATPGSEGGTNTGKLKEKFEQGQFQVMKEKEAIEFGDMCLLFKDFEFWRDRGFIVALHRIKNAGLIDIKDLHAAFLKNKEMLTKQHSHKQYTYNLAQVYNHGKHRIKPII